MSCITHQHHIAAMKARDKIGFDGSPKMHPGKIRVRDQGRNRVGPCAYEPFDKRAARAGQGLRVSMHHASCQRKALRVELQIPYHVLVIHGQDAKSNSAFSYVKLVQIMGGPAHGFLAADQTHKLRHLVRCDRPIGEYSLPGPGVDTLSANVQIRNNRSGASLPTEVCRGHMKIPGDVQSFEVGESNGFSTVQAAHQCHGQIAAANAAAACRHCLLIDDAPGGVTTEIARQRRTAHVAGQVNAEFFQSGDAFGNQDEPHSRLLSEIAALVDATALPLGPQRDRRHQTGNASAENRYVHWPNPQEYRSATYDGATPTMQFSLLTGRADWAS